MGYSLDETLIYLFDYFGVKALSEEQAVYIYFSLFVIMGVLYICNRIIKKINDSDV